MAELGQTARANQKRRTRKDLLQAASRLMKQGRKPSIDEIAEEALDLLPHAQLRVLEGTGFLMAYDDPVGLARELKAFCV